MKLFDAGVNLLHRQFRHDREAVAQRARQAGVTECLLISSNLAESREVIDWAAAHGMPCTAGVHPHDAAGVDADWTEQLLSLAQHPRVSAIGETGLDFNRNYSAPEQQALVFAKQIEIAQHVNKPLYVHDRDSGGALLNILQRAGHLPPVLVHCFTGTAAELHAYLDAGFYIGLTGWVSHPERGALLRSLVPEIPLERLLIETDAPFLRPSNVPPAWHKTHGLASRYKGRCEPAMLPYVVNELSRLRRESAADIAAATRTNAQRLFGPAPTHPEK